MGRRRNPRVAHCAAGSNHGASLNIGLAYACDPNSRHTGQVMGEEVWSNIRFLKQVRFQLLVVFTVHAIVIQNTHGYTKSGYPKGSSFYCGLHGWMSLFFIIATTAIGCPDSASFSNAVLCR